MKKILVLHLGDDEETTTASFLGQTIEIHRLGTGGDPDRAGALIAQYRWQGRCDRAGRLRGADSNSAQSRACMRSARR